MTDEKPNYYAIIPADVRYDSKLPASAKLMYGEITALTYKTGECWASNNYFAELYKTTPQAISWQLKKLEKHGYISIGYTCKGKEIDKRIIKLVSNTFDRYQINDEGGIKSICGGYQINFKENNTSINNTSINKKKVNKEKVTLEDIKAYIEEKNLNVDAQQFFDYFEAGNWTDSKGNKVKNWKQKLLTWNKYTKPATREIKTISYEEDAFKW